MIIFCHIYLIVNYSVCDLNLIVLVSVGAQFIAWFGFQKVAATVYL